MFRTRTRFRRRVRRSLKKSILIVRIYRSDYKCIANGRVGFPIRLRNFVEVIYIDEEWRDIRGFPGYQVSNLGRVKMHNKVVVTNGRGIRHYKDKIMKLRKDVKYNRWKVWLRKDGKQQLVLVARLVADAFCGEYRFTNMTVNHIDGDRSNNRSDNLEWMSVKDNLLDGFQKGLYAANMKDCTLIDQTNHVYNFDSMAQANRFLGRCQGYISSMVRRGYNTVTDKNGNVYIAKIGEYHPSSSPNTLVVIRKNGG